MSDHLPLSLHLFLLLLDHTLHTVFEGSGGLRSELLLLELELLLYVKMFLKDLVFLHLLLICIVLTDFCLFLGPKASGFLTIVNFSFNFVLYRQRALKTNSLLCVLLFLSLNLLPPLLALCMFDLLCYCLSSLISLFIVVAGHIGFLLLKVSHPLRLSHQFIQTLDLLLIT